MKYRTCYGCKFEGLPCAERAKMQAKVKGLGITSLKWVCDWKRPQFVPGEAVTAQIVIEPGFVDDYGHVARQETDTFPATVIQCVGVSKILVYIQPGEIGPNGYTFEPNNNGFCKVPRTYVRHREGPPEHVCPKCSNPVRLLGHANYCYDHPETAEFAADLRLGWAA